MELKVHLVDSNAQLVECWRRVFADCPDVSVSHGDILAVAENTIVSPANGRGFMDGGIDSDYLRYFGHRIQEAVIDEINKRDEGLLPVGASTIIDTKDNRIPFLILAPTMIAPEPVPKQNAYRAFRAALRIAGQNRDAVTRLFCPGMGTGVGCISPVDAASEMFEAYNDWRKSK